MLERPLYFSSELMPLADPGPSRKTQRKISFKMSVLRPSETVWGSSYGLFCVRGLKKMRAEISFKMSVLRPSETAWGQSYDLFCVSIGLRYASPCHSTCNFEHQKLVLFQVLEARDHQHQIELKISFQMSVLRPSETAWGQSYDLFCVSIGLRSA